MQRSLFDCFSEFYLYVKFVTEGYGYYFIDIMNPIQSDLP